MSLKLDKKKVLEDVYYEIVKQKCVLVVGPDIINFENNDSLFNKFCTKLINAGQLDEQYIFRREELIYPAENKPGYYCGKLKDFYQEIDFYDEIYDMISEIPFHLIISLIPDEKLFKSLKKVMGDDCQFGYLPIEGPVKQVKKPTKDFPLVFNFLGNVEKDDAVITFRQLFPFLERIFSKRCFPKNLRLALNDARSYLFLGVRYDRWYVQLFLKNLIKESKVNSFNYTVLAKDPESPKGIYYAKRVDAGFCESEPKQILKDLYEKCSGILRNQEMMDDPKSTVFLSYNSNDKSAAKKIKERLQKNRIKVIIDDNLNPNENIDEFMRITKEVDAVVAVISKNSLKSPYVIREICYTNAEDSKKKKEEKKLIPCSLDSTFENYITNQGGIKDEIHRAYKDQISKIINNMPFKKNSPYNRRLELYRSGLEKLEEVIDHLIDFKVTSVKEEDFESGMNSIIKKIQTLND